MTHLPTPGSGNSHSANRGRMVAIVVGLLLVELLGVAGLVVGLTMDLTSFAVIAVSAALVIVPILFAIALRSHVRK